jgi:phosphate transport system substrate-binding protein
MALMLASCSGQVLPASTPASDEAVILQLSATSATLPLINDLSYSYSRITAGISFEIISGSYQAAVRRALGDPSVYFLTNHLPEQSRLWGAPIGQDGIAIITHPNNPVTNLSIEQLRAIYQGRIDDWESLGGGAEAIIVISRESGSGTRAEFDRLLMGERQTTQSAQIAPSSAAVLASVARQPGSIGYLSLSYLDSSVQAMHIDKIAPSQANVEQNTYPLRTTLFFAGPGEPVGALRLFIAWVQSPEGQAVVAQRYTPMLSP